MAQLKSHRNVHLYPHSSAWQSPGSVQLHDMTVWICTVVTFPAWLIEKSMVPSRLWSLTTVQHEESLQENQWLTYGILGWGNSHYDSKLPGMTMRDVHQLETFEEPATVAWKNGRLPSLKIGGSPKKDMNHLPSPLIFRELSVFGGVSDIDR